MKSSDQRVNGSRRVSIVSSGVGYRFGGIGRVTSEVAQSLEEAGADVRFFPHRVGWSRAVRATLFSIEAIPLRFAERHVLFVEHVGLAGALERIGLGRTHATAVFLHGIEVWRPLGSAGREALLSASVILANSEYTVARAREANPWLPCVKVVPLGVRVPCEIDRSDTKRADVLIVGRMSRYERYKGHDELLDCWKAITRALPGCRLLIVGDGDDRPRLEERVRSEEIENVVFTGQVSEKTLEELYASASVFAFPSSREGFGLAALEAAAHGVPVVGLAGTAVEEALGPDGCGRFVDAGGSTRLGEVIIELLKDVDLARRIGESGRRTVERKYSAEAFRARVRAALRPLLDGD